MWWNFVNTQIFIWKPRNCHWRRVHLRQKVRERVPISNTSKIRPTATHTRYMPPHPDFDIIKSHLSRGRWGLNVGFDFWECSVHFGRGHACRLWRPVLNRFGGKMACSLSTQITLKSSGIVHNIEWNCYGLMCYIKYKVKMCLPAIDVI